MAHSVKRHLEVDAGAYDVEIRRFIPYYDDMLATGVELLAALAPPDAHVLDLGGGTGALSAAVLAGLPEAPRHAPRRRPSMLREARLGSPFGDRIDVSRGQLPRPAPRRGRRGGLAGAPPRPRPGRQGRPVPRGSRCAGPGRCVSQPRRGDNGGRAAERADFQTLGGPHGRARDHRRRGSRPLRRVERRGPLFPVGRGTAALARRFAEVDASGGAAGRRSAAPCVGAPRALRQPCPLCSVTIVAFSNHAGAEEVISGQLAVSCQWLAMPAGDA